MKRAYRSLGYAYQAMERQTQPVALLVFKILADYLDLWAGRVMYSKRIRSAPMQSPY